MPVIEYYDKQGKVAEVCAIVCCPCAAYGAGTLLD